MYAATIPTIPNQGMAPQPMNGSPWPSMGVSPMQRFQPQQGFTLTVPMGPTNQPIGIQMRNLNPNALTPQMLSITQPVGAPPHKVSPALSVEPDKFTPSPAVTEDTKVTNTGTPRETEEASPLSDLNKTDTVAMTPEEEKADLAGKIAGAAVKGVCQQNPKLLEGVSLENLNARLQDVQDPKKGKQTLVTFLQGQWPQLNDFHQWINHSRLSRMVGRHIESLVQKFVPPEFQWLVKAVFESDGNFLSPSAVSQALGGDPSAVVENKPKHHRFLPF